MPLLASMLLASVGCSGPSTPVAAVSMPVADGGSPGLPQSTQPPLGSLDHVGNNNRAWTAANFTVPQGEVMVSGWAADSSVQALAGGVDVVVDGIAYRAQYGLDRQDVAAARNVPAYAKSGFSFVLPGGSLAKGKHAVAIRVIAADKKSYSDLTVLTLEIE